MFTNFCFSENLLVAAANHFKVLKIFISLKVTVYIEDRRLPSEKAQGLEWKSNCTEMTKYTYDFKHKIEREKEREKEREREREREKAKPGQAVYIQQRRVQNPFQH